MTRRNWSQVRKVDGRDNGSRRLTSVRKCAETLGKGKVDGGAGTYSDEQSAGKPKDNLVQGKEAHHSEANTSRVAMDSETSGVMPIGATRKTGLVGVHIGPLIKENNSHAAPNQFPLIFVSLNQDG